MKKILALVLVAVAIGHVNAKSDNIGPKTPLGMSVVKTGNIFKLFYRAEEPGDVHVSILNQHGNVVFSEVIRKTDNFMRPYNFSTLPEGDYTIALSDGQMKRTEHVRHFHASSSRIVNAIRINKNENRYVLAVPNTGHDVLTIRVFDDRHSLLFQGREAVDGNFAKVFNLNDVKGTQLFEVTDDHGRTGRVMKTSVR